MKDNKTLLDLDIEELDRIRGKLVRHSYAYGISDTSNEEIFNLSEEILAIIKKLKALSKTLPY